MVASEYVKIYEWPNKKYPTGKKYKSQDDRIKELAQEMSAFIENLDDWQMGKIFYAKSEGRRVRDKTPYPYSCPIKECEEYFEDGNKLMVHLTAVHNYVGEIPEKQDETLSDQVIIPADNETVTGPATSR